MFIQKKLTTRFRKQLSLGKIGMMMLAGVLLMGNSTNVAKGSSPEKNFVRLSKIRVDPEKLEEYKAFLKEEVEESMRLEPGVLTLYAVSEKSDPTRFTILEIYADKDAYRSHLQTPHFKKYKEGTLQMVIELELVDTVPLIPGLKIR